MPKRVDREEQRARFVHASGSVIADDGLPAATLRSVAARAGCTTGALTHYFTDRDALLVATLRSVHAAAGRRMLARAAEPTDSRSRLRAVVLEAMPLDGARLAEWRVWIAFWGAANSDAALAEENTKRYADWQAMLTALFTPLLGSDPAARRAASKLIALVDGLGLRLCLCSGDDDAREAAMRRAVEDVDDFLHHLLEGVS